MAKYDGWTLGETEAILNIIGGTDVARAVLRGERKLTVEQIVRQQPVAKPPLVGTLVKTLHLKPNKVKSMADGIKLGKYNGHDSDIVQLFGSDEVKLTEPVSVDLFQFDRDWLYDEVLAWAKDKGNKQSIMPKHILGIGIQHPEEQREHPIVELGSVQLGRVLYLYGNSVWRDLIRYTVQGRWDRRYLVGFLSE